MPSLLAGRYVEPAQRLNFMIMEALQMHPYVEVVEMWGDGFCDWDDAASVRENFERRFGSDFDFDLILVQELSGQTEHADFLRELGIPMGIIFHECRAPYYDRLGCDEVLQLVRPAFAMFMNGDELIRCCVREAESSVLTVAPVAIALNVMRFNGPVTPPTPGEEGRSQADGDIDGRDIDVILPGMATVWYPLRRRLLVLVQRQVVTHADRLPRVSMETYANVLRRSKIVLTDSSAFRLALQKLGEAACSGALVMGEIPLDEASTYRDIIVPLAMNSTDEELADTIAWWLVNDDARRLWAHRAQAVCRERLTVRRYADVLLDAFEDFERKQFGVVVQTSLRLGCRAVQAWLRDELVGPNAWCDTTFADYSHYGELPDYEALRARAESDAVYWQAVAMLIGSGWIVYGLFSHVRRVRAVLAPVVRRVALCLFVSLRRTRRAD
jgi:hypothetical protein